MKRIITLSIAGLFVLGLVLSAYAAWPPAVIDKIKEWKDMAAAKKELPTSIPGVKVITGKELKKWMDTKKSFVLLDNRVKEQYEQERIVGAKWLLADHLLADESLASQYKKEDTIVLYCNGVLCWRSPATALMLQHLGYKNLYWYRDGIPEWKTNKFPTQ